LQADASVPLLDDGLEHTVLVRVRRGEILSSL
jgi:hypothetical protein